MGIEPLDSDVVRRAQRGDAWALDALVRWLEPYLGRICGAIASESGDDALQEALMVIVRNLGSLREPGALRGWARTIAVREAVRVARGASTAAADPDVLAATVPAGRDELTAVDVHAVLDGLAPEQRAVLVLRYLDGLDQEAMATMLDVAPGTVKSRLSRARAAFRARWTA